MSTLPVRVPAGFFALAPLAFVLLPLANVTTAQTCVDYSLYEIPVQLSAATGSVVALDYLGGTLYAAAGTDGLRILDETAPGAFAEVGAGATIAAARSVAVDDQHAYVTMDGRLQIFDVSDPHWPWLASTVEFPPGAGEVGEVVVEGDHAYVATDDGVQVIDVSDPASPVILTVWSGAWLYRTTALAVHDGVMYVGSRPDWIFTADVSDPSQPVEIGFYDPNAGEVRELRFEGGWLFALADEVLILDTSVPSELVHVGSMSPPGEPHDVTVLGNRAYLAQDAGPSLHVYDLSDPAAPSALGWVPVKANGNVISTSDHVISGTDTGVSAVDEDDVVFVPRAGEPIDKKGDLIQVHGSSLFVSSYRIWIYDVAEPLLPELASAPIGYGSITGGYGTDGQHHLVANEQNNDGHHFMTAWNIENPAGPSPIGGLGGGAFSMAVKDGHAFLVRSGQLEIRAIPFHLVATVPTQSSPGPIRILGETLYVLGESLEIFDVTDVLSPVSLSYLDLPGTSSTITIEGTLAYVGGDQAVHVVDISDPEAPVLLGSGATSAVSPRFGVLDGLVYLPSSDAAVEVVDFRDPLAPVHVSWIRPEKPFDARAIAIANGAVFIGTNSHIFLAKPQCTSSATPSPVVAAPTSRILVAPNPFADRTRVSFELVVPGRIRLDVYDVQGRRVRTLAEGQTPAGTHDVFWDGRLGNGLPSPAGVYFFRLEAPAGARAGKVIRVP